MESYEAVAYGALAMFILAIIVLGFLYTKVEDKKIEVKSLVKTDFYKDTEQLMFFVDFYVKESVRNILVPSSGANNGNNLIHDTKLNEAVYYSTKSTIDILSDEYKKLLENYTSDVNVLVTTLVHSKLTDYTLQMNEQTMNRKIKKR
jgi:hypothetical protein